MAISLGDSVICSQLFKTIKKANDWLFALKFDDYKKYEITLRYVDTKTKNGYAIYNLNWGDDND